MSITAERLPDSYSSPTIPFESRRLDRLMEAAGMDIVIATSKHNVQYLTGSDRAFFFDYMDAMGLSRYLPAFVYPKGTPDKAAYVGHRLEGFQRKVTPLWVGEVETASTGSIDAIEKAAVAAKRAVPAPKRIGVELAFLPMDAGAALARAFPHAELVDATPVLERQRAVKSAHELALLREASERVTDAMLAVIAGHGPGATTRELTEALRREEVARGLTFEYCLITAGRNLNRAPSDQRWDKGEPLSLDSGGNYHGYIGDLCRMAVMGEPDAELIDLLAEIETVQQAAMKPVRAGVRGGEIYAAAEASLAKMKSREHTHFLAHGMGLVSHEAPHLTSRGPVPYSDEDAHRPLEAGMVISVETTMQHPRRGFIKLEDTVAVTASGHDIYGERGRGWNKGGTAPRTWPAPAVD